MFANLLKRKKAAKASLCNYHLGEPLFTIVSQERVMLILTQMYKVLVHQCGERGPWHILKACRLLTA